MYLYYIIHLCHHYDVGCCYYCFACCCCCLFGVSFVCMYTRMRGGYLEGVCVCVCVCVCVLADLVRLILDCFVLTFPT